MAQSLTYTDKAVRESLYDVITNISPTETQLWSGLKKTTVNSTNYEWPVDVLNPIDTANAKVEGFDASFPTRVDPQRKSNYTQILSKEFHVSDTEREVNHAGFEDRYAYEMSKAMKEWANDAEYFLMRGAFATGSGTAARGMKGLLQSITTNTATGVALTEANLNDNLEKAWTSGGSVDEIYTSIKGKRKISAFTAGSTKQVDSDDKRLTNRVDVYESDMGVHKIFAHRWIDFGNSTATGFTIVGIQSDKNSVGSLRDPKQVSLAKTGSSTKGMVEGEITFIDYAEASGFKMTNLT